MKKIGKEHGYDLSTLQYIGEGTQGKVYKINEHTCIKIFKKKETCKKELDTLTMAQGNKFFPALYSFGEKFIVREFVDGIELDKYLKNRPLTLDISKKLIDIYEALGLVGYKRQDTALLHIFINSKGELRVIDTAKAMSKSYKYPKIIMTDLKNLRLKDAFLSHVKQLNPELYKYLNK